MSTFGNIAAGLGLGLMAHKTRQSNEAARRARYAKLGIPYPEPEASPLDKVVDWVKSKAPAATDQAAAPSGDGAGLLDRLKAGNIDQPGSEAYNRWGQGKADGDAAELVRESRRVTPAGATSGAVTAEQQSAVPAQVDASITAARERAELITRDDWDNGPSDPLREPAPFVSSQG